MNVVVIGDGDGDGDDLAQDVFLAAMTNLHSLREPQAVPSTASLAHDSRALAEAYRSY